MDKGEAIAPRAAADYDKDDIQYFHGWIQAISGAAWPEEWENRVNRRSFAFSFVIVFEFLLTIGPILALGDIILRLIIYSRRQLMTLKTIMELRDISLKMYLLKALQDPTVKTFVGGTNQQDIEAMLNRIFDEVNLDWKSKYYPEFGLSDFQTWAENITPSSPPAP